MPWDASYSFAKRGGRGVTIALLDAQCAYCVPCVRTTLASVKMSVAFRRKLALERFERSLCIAAGEADETTQPVKGNSAESRRAP